MQRSVPTAIATAAGSATAVAVLLFGAFGGPTPRIAPPTVPDSDALSEPHPVARSLPTTRPVDAAAVHVAVAAEDAHHRALESGADEARLDAIAALGDAEQGTATGVLVSLLDDAHVAVREQAVESLGAIGGDEAVAGLAYALTDDRASVRHLAIDVLSEIGSETAIGALALTLDDADVGVREHAIDALADLDGAAAAAVRQRFAADREARIRELAAAAAEDDR